MSLTPGAQAALSRLSEAEARALLMEVGAAAALRSFDRDCAQRFAAQLLAQRNTRPQIRDRLKIRFGVSERSAYRAIDAAIQSRNPAKTLLVVADGARIFDIPQPRQHTHEKFFRFDQS